jgi:hypothetical protein
VVPDNLTAAGLCRSAMAVPPTAFTARFAADLSMMALESIVSQWTS